MWFVPDKVINDDCRHEPERDAITLMHLMNYRLHNSTAINQGVKSVVIQLYDATLMIKKSFVSRRSDEHSIGSCREPLVCDLPDVTSHMRPILVISCTTK